MTSFELFSLSLQSLILLGVLATLLQARRGGGLTRRAAVRDAIGERAWLYAEQMGGSGEEKLRHALGCAQQLDLADNRRRDYSDAELRFAIEAAGARQD